MVAFKNHLMIKESSQSKNDIHIIRTYPSVGHVYSVMIEEIGITNPNLANFIAKLNKYIALGGNGFACVESPLDNLYDRTAVKFCRFLEGEYPELPPATFEKIAKEAYGGCIDY